MKKFKRIAKMMVLGVAFIFGVRATIAALNAEVIMV